MSTINISLPKEQVGLVDRLVSIYGFANRSEFIRSLLRLVIHQPEIVDKASVFPFVSPKEKSAAKIIAGLKQTKKYNRAFIKDLEEGLSASNYFTK